MWIGVDFDGTLVNDEWPEIGEPIPLMMDRVRAWLSEGIEIRIFTARANAPYHVKIIEQWSRAHFGTTLTVTACKNLQMSQLWDDRAIGVEKNTGIVLSGHK